MSLSVKCSCGWVGQEEHIPAHMAACPDWKEPSTPQPSGEDQWAPGGGLIHPPDDWRDCPLCKGGDGRSHPLHSRASQPPPQPSEDASCVAPLTVGDCVAPLTVGANQPSGEHEGIVVHIGGQLYLVAQAIGWNEETGQPLQWKKYSEVDAKSVISELQSIGKMASENGRLAAELAAAKAELAKHQESQFHPDWSMLQATRESLREHMRNERRLMDELAAAKAEVERWKEKFHTQTSANASSLAAAKDWHRATDQMEAERDAARADAQRERERADKLQAFKDFVHHRLDQAGIPTHPEGSHSKEGCRVGDRLDILQAERDDAVRREKEMAPEYMECRKAIGGELAQAEADAARLRGLLREAYGYTTADTGNLPERIKAALAADGASNPRGQPAAGGPVNQPAPGPLGCAGVVGQTAEESP